MWAVVALIGLIAVLVGFVSIIYPLRFLRIRSRLQGLALFGFGIAAFIIAGINSPRTERNEAATQDPAPVAAAASSSPTPAAPSPPAPVEQSPSGPKRPSSQTAFIETAQSARAAYRAAETDFQKGATRPARAKALCQSVPSTQIKDWVGEVTDLTTNGEGKGVIEIKIAEHVYVSTWNNSVSDIGSNTLIEPGSPLFESLGKIKEGDIVVFSGRFISSNTDCFQEKSITMSGSMNDPDYLVRFSSVRVQNP